MQFYVEDCTGCGLCVEACPETSPREADVKAINMADKLPLLTAERANIAFFETLPVNDRARVDFADVRGVQFLEPLFEFSGMMRRVRKPQAGEPSPVHQRPGRSVVVMTVPQQEVGQLLTGLTKCPHRCQTRPHQIADRLMCRVGNPHRRQFASPMQLGEVDRVSPIGLDPLAWLAGDQRRSDHDAVVLRRGQLSLNAVTARSGFVAEPQLMAMACQLRNQRLHGSRRVRDLAMLAHLTPLARLSERHRNRVLVHIQTDVRDRLVHDPSPMHEARHRPSRRNPRKPAYCEAGRPYLRRTSGLDGPVPEYVPLG